MDDGHNLSDPDEAAYMHGRLSQNAQNLSTWIKVSKPFKAWLYTEQSRVLFVNGGASSHIDHSPVVAASHHCAESLRAHHRGFVLRFTCQATSGDPRSMAVWLLGQLVRKSDDISFPLRHPCELSTNALAELIVECTRRQLRQTPVFCFINDIDLYEVNGGFEEDTRTVLTNLASITAYKDPGTHNFKLLVTSITQC